MFTIKYRAFEVPQDVAPVDAPRHYTQIERLDGPFESVSTRYEGGQLVICASRDELSPGMTYGPAGETPDGLPRPTLWVMNEQGATIAKYDL